MSYIPKFIQQEKKEEDEQTDESKESVVEETLGPLPDIIEVVERGSDFDSTVDSDLRKYFLSMLSDISPQNDENWQTK